MCCTVYYKYIIIYYRTSPFKHILKRLARKKLGACWAKYSLFGRTLEAPIPKMRGLVKKVGPFSKRKNPL